MRCLFFFLKPAWKARTWRCFYVFIEFSAGIPFSAGPHHLICYPACLLHDGTALNIVEYVMISLFLFISCLLYRFYVVTVKQKLSLLNVFVFTVCLFRIHVDFSLLFFVLFPSAVSFSFFLSQLDVHLQPSVRRFRINFSIIFMSAFSARNVVYLLVHFLADRFDWRVSW